MTQFRSGQEVVLFLSRLRERGTKSGETQPHFYVMTSNSTQGKVGDEASWEKHPLEPKSMRLKSQFNAVLTAEFCKTIDVQLKVGITFTVY